MSNLFGKGERVEGNLFLGMETASPFSIVFTKPVPSNPVNNFQVSLYQNLHKFLFNNSYQESQLGTNMAFNFVNKLGKHSIMYDYAWRNIFGMQESASATILGSAGHSVKSAIKYIFSRSSLNDPFIPTCGYSIKLSQVTLCLHIFDHHP